MSDAAPDLHMLNVIVADMAASLEFYRLLGAPAPEVAGAGSGASGSDASGPDTSGADTSGADASGASAASAVHAQLRLPSGFSLELDTADSAQVWHAGWRADPSSVGVVIGFSLPSRAAVDERYDALTAAGHRGRQPPFDAFWGARYAIVADPDGNDVGLMSPVEEARRTWPPEQSPPASTVS